MPGEITSTLAQRGRGWFGWTACGISGVTGCEDYLAKRSPINTSRDSGCAARTDAGSPLSSIFDRPESFNTFRRILCWSGLVKTSFITCINISAAARARRGAEDWTKTLIPNVNSQDLAVHIMTGCLTAQ